MNMDFNEAYNYLIDNGLFTEEELKLVCSGWGSNMDTLNRICQVRYGMDVDQLEDEH